MEKWPPHARICGVIKGSMFRKRLGAVWLMLMAGCAMAEEWKMDFPEATVDRWQGHERHVFSVAGKKAWVVVPAQPAAGRLWTWVTEFPDAFFPRTGVPQLLKEHGIYHAHVSDFNRLGCDEQLKVMDAFYDLMVQKGFAKKPVMIGLSRGGFMAYRWAAAHPDRVAGIYGDAPVCDLKSWPGGFGKGKGSKGDWEKAKSLYGWKSDEEGKAFQGNAVDDGPLGILAKHKVPLYHVVGDTDDVVPVAENTGIVERKYKQLGGEITVMHHAAGHHPHGLDDPAPTVAFIVKALKAANP
jgi:pimeloyl-ACP methyl ester carboxylesterase